MNTRFIGAQQLVSLRPRLQLATLEHQLRFPLRVIGQSNAPLVAQRVGTHWWIEPLTPQTRLPVRAALRLGAILASGVELKGAVVFHEVNAQVPSRPLALQRRLARAKLWADQELPVQAEHVLSEVGRATRQYGPVLARALLAGAGIVLAGSALLIGAAVAVIATACGALLSDPCLVVVTTDGPWIEI